MPLRKKHTLRNRILIWLLIAAIMTLLVISFAPNQYTTEIILFP